MGKKIICVQSFFNVGWKYQVSTGQYKKLDS